MKTEEIKQQLEQQFKTLFSLGAQASIINEKEAAINILNALSSLKFAIFNLEDNDNEE